MTNEARFLQLVVPEEELEVFCEGSVVVLRVVRRITMIPRVNGIDRTFQVTNEDSMAMISVHALCPLAHHVIERERERAVLTHAPKDLHQQPAQVREYMSIEFVPVVSFGAKKTVDENDRAALSFLFRLIQFICHIDAIAEFCGRKGSPGA